MHKIKIIISRAEEEKFTYNIFVRRKTHILSRAGGEKCTYNI